METNKENKEVKKVVNKEVNTTNQEVKVNDVPNQPIDSSNQPLQQSNKVNPTPITNKEESPLKESKTIEKDSTKDTTKEVKEVLDNQKEVLDNQPETLDLSDDNKELEGKAKEGVKGLGDVIKKVTNAIGIETCDECEKRRKKLNRLFPFTRVVKELISDEEIAFINSIDKKITTEQRYELGDIFDRVFKSKTRHCQCPAVYKNMIDRLKIQIDYQNIK